MTIRPFPIFAVLLAATLWSRGGHCEPEPTITIDNKTYRYSEVPPQHSDLLEKYKAQVQADKEAQATVETGPFVAQAEKVRLPFSVPDPSEAAFSDNGEMVALIGPDRVLRVWHVASARLRRTFATRERVGALAFSPNGEMLAGASIVDEGAPRATGTSPINSTLIRVWNIQTGRLEHTWHSEIVRSLAFSPDGIRLLAGGGPQTDALVTSWNLRTGSQIRVRVPDTLYAVAFAADGKSWMCAGESGIVRRYDARTGYEKPEQTAGHYRIHGLSLSPSGSLLAINAFSDRLWIKDFRSGPLYASKNQSFASSYGFGGSHVLAFSPDSRVLVDAVQPNRVMLWQSETGQLLQMLPTRGGFISSVTFSSDGTKLFATTSEGALLVWRLKQPGAKIKSATSSVPNNQASPAAVRKPLILGAFRSLPQTFQLAGAIAPTYHMAFSPSAALLAGADPQGVVRLWETKNGRLLQTLKGHSDKVYALVFSPNGEVVSSAGADHSIRLWNARSGKLQRVWHSKSTPVDLAFSPRGDLLISLQAEDTMLKNAPYRRSVMRHDLHTGEQSQLDAFKPSDSVPISVTFTPDGAAFLLSYTGGVITQHDARSGRPTELATLKHLGSAGYGYGAQLTFSPGSNVLAWHDAASNILFLNLDTGQQSSLRAANETRQPFAFAPNGAVLADAIGGGVRIRDIRSGHVIQLLEVQDLELRRLAFTPDGRNLLGANAKGRLFKWHLNRENSSRLFSSSSDRTSRKWRGFTPHS